MDACVGFVFAGWPDDQAAELADGLFELAAGVALVTDEVGDSGSTSFERLHLDAVRWETLTIDAGGCLSRDDVSACVAAAVRTAVGTIGDRLLAARVVIEGVSAAHASLAGDAEALRYEVIAAAADVAAGQVWVESVALATKGS